MKIVVCIKQVPDATEIRLDSKTGTMSLEGVPRIINPDDKAGLEAALRLREQVGGSVTVVSMGPSQADTALREALAMGADEAYLLSAPEFDGSDTYATAAILAAALKKLGYDLIVTGRQAIDGDTAQVGPQIAEQLKIPHAGYAKELTVEDGSIIVKRQFEDQDHVLKLPMPCLVTALSELAEPRYMDLGALLDAYNTEIKVWGFDDLKANLNPDWIGLTGSPTEVLMSFGKRPQKSGHSLTGLSADEAVDAIMEKLIELHII